MYFGARSERVLRNVDSRWPGCPERRGHGRRLVIIEYLDADEVQSHDTRGTSASKPV